MDKLTMTFTSFSDSMRLNGLKLALDRKPPRKCGYPTLPYLFVPRIQHLSLESTVDVYKTVLDSNWPLLKELLGEVWKLGLADMVLCCWCPKELYRNDRFCTAEIIGEYILEHSDELEFPVAVIYREGRGDNRHGAEQKGIDGEPFIVGKSGLGTGLLVPSDHSVKDGNRSDGDEVSSQGDNH